MGIFSRIFSAQNKSNRASGKVIGVDIGSSSIKVVEVEERSGVLTLTTYGELQLGPYSSTEVGQSVNLAPNQEKQALVDILRESAVKASSAVLSMPLSSSFVTTIDFKAEPKEDLNSKVRVEARKYIPAAISEVTLDWAEIEGEPGANEKNHSVLLAAIQNEALARFNDLMGFVKLPNPPTEIECFSSVRALYNPEDELVGIVDIGATSTKLYIAKQGLVQRMHRVRAGGSIATKRIAGTLGIDFAEAELLKRQFDDGADEAFEIKRAHHGSYERAFHEYRLVINEYEKSFDKKINTIYLSGGGSLFPGTDALLADALQRDVVRADPFSKVSYPSFMEDMLTEIGPSFCVSLGAAIRMFE
jgi:type IV pilus assembly protein PilM